MENINNNPVTEEKEIKETSQFYAYCRIPGGLQFQIADGKDEKTVILKSGTSKTEAPDGTVTFSVNPDIFGVTVLNKNEKTQIEEQLKKSRLYQAGFVFFAKDKTEGDRKAAENIRKNPHIGLEPLDGKSLTAATQVFSE